MIPPTEPAIKITINISNGCADTREEQIVGCKTNPGNVNDNNGSVEFLDEYIDEHPEVENIVMDAGYTGPVLLNQIIEKGKKPIVPYTTPKGNNKNITKTRFKINNFR